MQNIKTKLHYPRLLTLVTCIIAAYSLFHMGAFDRLPDLLKGQGYISIFLAGFLFAYGFTAPFAVGILVAMTTEVNIYLGALIAGLGAYISDVLIFSFIQGSFREEFDKLKLTRFMQWIKNVFDNHFSERLRQYLLWTFSGFLIASPLPDEFGVSMLSGFTRINKKVFSILAYSLNTIGIFLIMLMASTF